MKAKAMARAMAMVTKATANLEERIFSKFVMLIKCSRQKRWSPNHHHHHQMMTAMETETAAEENSFLGVCCQASILFMIMMKRSRQKR